MSRSRELFAVTQSIGRSSGGPAPEVLLSSAGAGWRSVAVQQRLHPGGEYEYDGFGYHHISVNAGGSLKVGRSCGDLPVREVTTGRGAVGIVPAGRPALWRHEEECEFIGVRLDPELLETVAREEGLGEEIELVEALVVTDTRIEWISQALVSEAATSGAADGLYADSLANLLAVHLLRHHSTLGNRGVRKIMPDDGRPRKGLSSSALKRVRDYVEANLADRISVEGMAAAASLSRYHFTRLFKQSTGLSPHQYVIRHRVERARELLSCTSLPVYDIAREAGFSHQQHLGRHFRRMLGISPGRFREQSLR